MQIIKIEPPTGSLYSGLAISTRGRRYDWCATFSGKIRAVFREYPNDVLPSGMTYWHKIKAPPALAAAVRVAVRKALH